MKESHKEEAIERQKVDPVNDDRKVCVSRVFDDVRCDLECLWVASETRTDNERVETREPLLNVSDGLFVRTGSDHGMDDQVWTIALDRDPRVLLAKDV